MLLTKDRVKELVSSTGTTTLSLSGAESGFQAFSVLGNNTSCNYTIVDVNSTAWEVGRGVYNSNTLTRDEVFESSSGGSKINLSATGSTVFLTYPGSKAAYKDIGVNRDYTASGSITAGKPLILNADNTVTQVAETSTSFAVGTSEEIATTSSNDDYQVVYDTYRNKALAIYRNGASPYNVLYKVGTIDTSANTITWGTAGNVNTTGTHNVRAVYDEVQQATVVFYNDNNTSPQTGKCLAITLDASGNATVGSTGTFSSNPVSSVSATYCQGVGTVVAYDVSSGNFESRVVTVSGTTVTVGTAYTVTTNEISYSSIAYDTTNNKVVVVYADITAGYYSTYAVGSISGTTVTYETPVVFISNATPRLFNSYALVFNKENSKFIYNGYTLNTGQVYVGSLSGTTVTWGSAQQYSTTTHSQTISYNPTTKNTLLAYRNTSTNYPVARTITLNGSTATFGTETNLSTINVTGNIVQTNSANTKSIASYVDNTNNNYDGNVVTMPTSSSNLTIDNYFGIASTTASDTESVGVNRAGSFNNDQTGLTAGKDYYAKDDGTIVERATTTTTPNTFATATIESLTTVNPSASQKIDIIYDTHNDKVWAYSKDSDNSNYPTVVVGDISSGTSITWGTPVTVTSNSYAPTGTQSQRNLASDGAGNILVAYRDTSNDYARVKVGNYSGTNSATFGSELQPDNISALQTIDIGYCSSANLWYMFHGNSSSTKYALIKQNSGNQNFNSWDVGTLHTGNATGINNVYTSNNKIIVGLDATGDGKFYVCNTSADGSTNTGYTLNIGTVQNITITNNSSGDGRLKIITDTTNNNYILIDSTGSTGMNCSVITESSGSLTQSTPQGVANSSGTMASNTAFYNPSDQKFYGAYQVYSSPYACKNYLLTVSGTTFTYVDGVDMPNATDRGVWTQGIYIADITKGVFVGQTNNGYDLLTAIMSIGSTTTTTINASQFVGTARSGTDLELAEPPTELVGFSESAITKGRAVIIKSDGNYAQVGLTSTSVTNTGTASQGSLGNIGTYNSDMFAMAVASDGVTYCLTYQNTSTQQACKIGTRSGETITWGSELVLASGNSNSHFVSYDASANVFLTTYTTGNLVKGTAVSFSGNTGTKGTEVTIMDLGSSSGNPSYNYQHWYDSTNKITVCWAQGGVSGNQTNRSSAVALTLTGTSISVGTLYENTSAGGSKQKGCDVTGGKHVLYWNNSSNYPSVMTMTVTSSGAISWGTSLVINSASGGFCNPIYNPNYENKAILAGKIATSSNYFSYAGLTISGTSITASNYSDGNINNAQSYVESGGNVGVYSNYSGNYCFVYQTYSPYNSRYNFATTTDGLSLTVATAVTTTAHGSNQFYAGACASDVDGVVVENHNDRSSSPGYYSYYCFNPTFNFTSTTTAPNMTSANVIGIAQETILANNDIKVKTFGQVDENQSSLTTGSAYFVNGTTGEIQTTADSPSVNIGTALNSTNLLIKS